MRLDEARQIANRVKELLTQYCERIEIVGSVVTVYSMSKGKG